MSTLCESLLTFAHCGLFLFAALVSAVAALTAAALFSGIYVR